MPTFLHPKEMTKPEERRPFYPETAPYNTFMLDVGQGHRLHVQEVGNPKGIPALFLHGGPGGGISPHAHRFFNPEAFRVILFDQRGCGQSEPFASVAHNTTWDLVADIEKIRTYLGIEQWLVVGGSWGSTLALTYAQTHPEQVSELLLRGVFMCRKSELLWFYQEGANHLFPDAFEPYRSFIPKEEQHNFIHAYYQRLMNDADEATQLEAAKRWSTWEMATSRLHVDAETLEKGEDPRFVLPFARIESHYFQHDAFLEEGQLLKNAGRMAHIPTTIVQGRYDVICPPVSAWQLHQALPKSVLYIIPDAGHSDKEPGTADAMIRALDKAAKHKG